MNAELAKVIEQVKGEYGESGAKVVYYEENELGVTFAAILGESGTIYHMDAYGRLTSYEARPVAL